MQGSTDSQSRISSVLPGAASCRNQCFTYYIKGTESTVNHLCLSSILIREGLLIMENTRFAGILGTGHYAPEKILTNADLEKMVDTSDEWIRTRTGIETRHIAHSRKIRQTSAFMRQSRPWKRPVSRRMILISFWWLRHLLTM